MEVLDLRAYASLKDVAALAHVSFQTAGKVLNAAPDVRVSAETERRIRQAAAKLSYRPNAVARSLLERSTATIGLLIGDVTDAVSPRIAVGVLEEASNRGFAILLASLPARSTNATDALRMLLERRVDGVILAPPQLEEDHEFAEVVRSSVPAVVLQHVLGGQVPFVGPSDRQAGLVATEHLLEMGHRYVGTVTGPYRRRAVRSRLLGYEEALQASGATMSEDLVAEGDWSAKSGAQGVRMLLEREPRMTAVFVHNDEMAIGALREMHYLGRRVPEDVAIVGCDDLPFAELLTPSLSSVSVPFVEIGRKAVTLLVRQMEGRAVADDSLLPVALSIRESSLFAPGQSGVTATSEPKALATPRRQHIVEAPEPEWEVH